MDLLQIVIEACQSPIVTGIAGLLIGGVFVGMAGNYFGEKYTDKRREKESTSSVTNNFSKCEKLMPELFAEMRTDLVNHPLIREFILMGKGWVYSSDPNKSPPLAYYFEDHEQLKEKVELLVSNNFVKNITYNKVDRYQMTEEFVSLLA